MRGLIVVTVLGLISTPAFAGSCVFDTDCKPGHSCMDGVCTGDMPSANDNDYVPTKRTDGKSCEDDGDCKQGARCIKGSGFQGVCIGH
jgi:hypothetical protein